MPALRRRPDRGDGGGPRRPPLRLARGRIAALALLAPLALFALLTGCAGGASASRPAVCQGHADNTLLPIPPSLAPLVAAAFHARMTSAEVVRNGVLRCDGDAVLACLVGANLNCGLADRSRHNRGAEAWCSTHPEADFVPKFASGHETVFDWRCAGGRAVTARQMQEVDAHGFVHGAWRRLPLRPAAPG